MKKILLSLIISITSVYAQSQCLHNFQDVTDKDIQVGAERMEMYLPLLKKKRVAIVANQTSVVKGRHLVDTLVSRHIKIVKVFSPEHGFRGSADAGEAVNSTKDKKTGISLVSLYGDVKKPKPEDMKDIDIMVFDMQDVGARFYTYISTMTLCMEACAKRGIPFIVLDRPNPNGHYVDGPVLKSAYKSFIGMHEIPVVHGMTIAEYAQMVNGECWLSDSSECSLITIPVKGYTHQQLYQLPVNPSPNLRSMKAIYLYPSVCFFEGTVVSLGRGTDYPFQIIGHPCFKGEALYEFVPDSTFGAKKPMFKGETCYGWDLRDYALRYIRYSGKLDLSWLIKAYQLWGGGSDFFTSYFNYIAGTKELKQQIMDGMTEEQIRESWKNDLDAFKETRRRYLLYPDFE